MADETALHIGESLGRRLDIVDMDGLPQAPDSTPTFTVYKDNISTGQVVTVTPIGTGEYWYAWTPGAPVEGEVYELRATVIIGGDTRYKSLFVSMIEPERGTNNGPTASKLLAYLQLLFRKDAAIATDNATELAEINADGGSGVGSYTPTTDSNEAHADALVVTVGGVGAHVISLTVRLDSMAVVAGCDVWVTPSGASTPVYASGVTDSDGVVSFNLDAGTYRVYRQKIGIDFDESYVTMTIDSDGGVEFS